RCHHLSVAPADDAAGIRVAEPDAAGAPDGAKACAGDGDLRSRHAAAWIDAADRRRGGVGDLRHEAVGTAAAVGRLDGAASGAGEAVGGPAGEVDVAR